MKIQLIFLILLLATFGMDAQAREFADTSDSISLGEYIIYIKDQNRKIVGVMSGEVELSDNGQMVIFESSLSENEYERGESQEQAIVDEGCEDPLCCALGYLECMNEGLLTPEACLERFQGCLDDVGESFGQPCDEYMEEHPDSDLNADCSCPTDYDEGSCSNCEFDCGQCRATCYDEIPFNNPFCQEEEQECEEEDEDEERYIPPIYDNLVCPDFDPADFGCGDCDNGECIECRIDELCEFLADLPFGCSYDGEDWSVFCVVP